MGEEANSERRTTNLNPERRTFAHCRQLSGLEMRESEGWKITVLLCECR